MKRKEVEEVIGAGDSWENVDQMDGMESPLILYENNGQRIKLMTDMTTGTVQCPNEKCESTRAFFYQLQIRSADEPMTSFFKVGTSNWKTYKR
jgi:DNA-directed RNA polymerase III subunit RPC11